MRPKSTPAQSTEKPFTPPSRLKAATQPICPQSATTAANAISHPKRPNRYHHRQTAGQVVKYKAPVKTVSKPAKSNTPPPQQAPSNNSRRSILETELSNERKALVEAQKMLSQARLAKGGNINHQEINALQSNVLDRQQNIQALQRELGRM